MKILKQIKFHSKLDSRQFVKQNHLRHNLKIKLDILEAEFSRLYLINQNKLSFDI